MSRARLTDLFNRLSHLDCCVSEIGNRDPQTMSAQELEQLIKRLEGVVTRLESSGAKVHAESLGSDGEVGPTVTAYDEIVSGSFAEYLKLSKQIGGDVAEHASMVDSAFKLQRSFIEVASKSKKPSTDQFMALLKPQSEQIQNIQQFRETKRSSPFFNHLTAISESIPALGWVAVSPTPAPYVKEMSDASQFYTNRVIKDYKEKDKTHFEWTKIWLQVLAQLHAYVKQYHTTGLVWNPRGVDPSTLKTASAPPPPPPNMPPPPPPPSADFLLGKTSSTKDDGDTRAALFASINQGADITRGLKKVSADQMTHKNPNLRGSSIVPAKESVNSPARAGSAIKPVVAKAPKCELDGKKWIVEYQKDVPQLVLDNVQMNQVIYIYSCQNTVVIIKGKCNSVSVDNCKKTSLVFDDILSTVEFINCQSVKAQAMGKVPTVSIDKTDGAHVYLSSSCLETEIVTSKSSEVNVSVPQNEDGDYTECPIPEQFKSTWNGKAMKTEMLDVAA